MTAVRLLVRAGAGLLAGLVGGLAMTLVMLVSRSLLGISPPLEMIPDRFAPTLTIEQFFALIVQYGGYNELKQFGVSAVLAGQLAVAALLGLVYGLVDRNPSPPSPLSRARERGRRSHWLLGGAVAVLWVASLAILWPTLPTSFIGLPPTLAAPVTALGLLVAYATYGLVLALAYGELTRPGKPDGARGAMATSIGRRALLVGGFGAALTLGTGVLARRLWDLASFAYDGARFWGPLTPITPNDLFYVVTKNVVDPGVERNVWRLEIGGLVERPRSYSFTEITALASTVQETTLMCISNGVGDALMSNARWTGIPLRTLLDAAGPHPGGIEALLRGADGYTDTIPLAKALDPSTLVVFEMNGEPLPRIHGYPVRLIVPGMYGEKNVKWVTGIEIVDHDVKGFYEQQGWGPDFEIPIRSRFYEPDLSEPIRLGAVVGLRGIVFGGDKGISRAEVSLDGGQSWQPAELEYPGTRLSWAIWRYQWRPELAGEYFLAVRGFDASGAPQPAEDRGIVPSGGRGYHRITVSVVA
ncbi:MAG TPA: molybdopterin-dependent oxidoreductase [Chloroflexota bacterium]|nr:molybdopterin-dependent oxidoreductase [Chloroflexota bacterium]